MSKRYDYVGNDVYKKYLDPDSMRFQTNPSIRRTAIIERMYMRLMTELATNRFKWSGMPASVDLRALELNLFYRALSVFFFDDNYDQYFCLQGGAVGSFNMMYNPKKFRVNGVGYPTRELRAVNAVLPVPRMDREGNPIPDCVPIWANYLRVPDLDIVQIYAKRLAEIDTTLEINTRNARRTKIIVTDENTRLSTENIVRQINEGAPHISVNRPIDGMISAVDLGVNPDALINMDIFRTRQWNTMAGLLGINNSNQDKKERLVEDEVSANDDIVMSNRNVALNARKQAVELINRRYGLAVEVEYNNDVEKQLKSVVYGDDV